MLETVIKMISDPNRLRIIHLIKDNSLCVGEIQTLLGTMQSNTSRHLDKLKSSGLIIGTKDAQRVFYKLDNKFIEQYQFLSILLYKDLTQEPQFMEDLERLSVYKASGLNCEDLRALNFDYNRIK